MSCIANLCECQSSLVALSWIDWSVINSAPSVIEEGAVILLLTWLQKRWDVFLTGDNECYYHKRKVIGSILQSECEMLSNPLYFSGEMWNFNWLPFEASLHLKCHLTVDNSSFKTTCSQLCLPNILSSLKQLPGGDRCTSWELQPIVIDWA